MVLTYQNFDDAIQACYTLKDSVYEERNLSGTVKSIDFIMYDFIETVNLY